MPSAATGIWACAAIVCVRGAAQRAREVGSARRCLLSHGPSAAAAAAAAALEIQRKAKVDDPTAK
eukprot:855674-Lingulodinium_polyedra.AAC.1